MSRISFSRLDPLIMHQFLRIRDSGVATYDWLQPENIVLSNREQAYLNDIQARLLNERLQLMNEATIWARAIYPLLVLAERDTIRAYAGVHLIAQYPRLVFDETIDGILGQANAGQIEVSHLLVLHVKRGLDAKKLQMQLYGQMLAAAYLNWQIDQRIPQEIFGCYTIFDTWTFVRCEVEGFEDEQVSLRVEFSREFSERLEAATILKILKGIIARRLAQTELASTG
ncbi:MAG: hypothetical protein ACFB8W_09215 [Elainellaceae cyanobacterium]